MKKLYSLFALIALLFTASGCEDDYRSMVLFEGVEPIYQIGTCDNLVSNLSYYLSETKLLQKSGIRKNEVIELIYRGFI